MLTHSVPLNDINAWGEPDGSTGKKLNGSKPLGLLQVTTHVRSINVFLERSINFPLRILPMLKFDISGFLRTLQGYISDSINRCATISARRRLGSPRPEQCKWRCKCLLRRRSTLHRKILNRSLVSSLLRIQRNHSIHNFGCLSSGFRETGET